MMRIIAGDLGDPRVIELLDIHLTSARAQTAPGYVLDPNSVFMTIGL